MKSLQTRDDSNIFREEMTLIDKSKISTYFVKIRLSKSSFLIDIFFGQMHFFTRKVAA